MAISFFNEDVERPQFKINKIKKWIKKIIEDSGKTTGDINYIFCSDEYLLKINKEFLNHDYYTDIITFNYCENNVISGDIFISTERVEDNSIQLETGDSELFRVIIHGILHLTGLEDHSEEERKIMRKAEDDALNIWEDLFKD